VTDPVGLFPQWPLSIPALAWLGLLLIAATLVGQVVHARLGWPRPVGYLAAGLILGPEVVGLFRAETLGDLALFRDIALGLLLFEIGQRIDLGWLRRNPALLGASVLEALASFAAVFAVLSWFEVRPVTAAAVAVLGVATSPAIVLAVVRDAGARGQVTERVLLLTGLNTAYAVVALALIFGWLRFEDDYPLQVMLLHPAWLLAGSLLAGALLAAAMLAMFRAQTPTPSVQFCITVGMVLCGVALAGSLGLSTPLVLLLTGLIARVLDRDRRFLALHLGDSALLFIVMLFALTGAGLSLAGWRDQLPLALAVIAARLAAKIAATAALARATGISTGRGALVGVGLAPMSGLALLMLEELARTSPRLAEELTAVALLAVTVLAFAGPLLLLAALRRAGDVPGHDEARR
jgi:Kef-type K+ transport system membrane component KefB